MARFVRHNLSDILKAPPRDDVVEVDGGAFLGGNGVLQKEVPDRVVNITSHNKKTTNHRKILTQVHILVEMFVSLRYTTYLMYFMKYNFMKKSRQDM